jgi:hypothetical protein
MVLLHTEKPIIHTRLSSDICRLVAGKSPYAKRPGLLTRRAEKTPAPQGNHSSGTTSAFNRRFLFFAAQRRDRIPIY